MANTTRSRTGPGFSAEERAAMKARSEELKAARLSGGRKDRAAAEEEACLTAIADLPEGDRALAEAVHTVVRDAAPDLLPKTWYGMPAYARGGKVVCFFQGAEKFSSRYATLGFNDPAALDDGPMWPTAFALVDWNDHVEQRVRDLVTRAAG